MNIDPNNPWHGVSFGEHAPEIVNAIIEIPKNTRAKCELDKDSGLLKLDRVLYSSVYYPANYGFVPRTYFTDNDPLDIVVLSQIEIVPMCIVPAKIIGVMHMVDGGESDDKIIAVAANDMSVSHINDIDELPEHFFKELQSFFEDYKKLEKKEVKIEGFKDRATAIEIVKDSIDAYQLYIQDSE